jgi:hypothetical protein
VTQVQVNFDQLVSLPATPANAFQLKRQSDNALVGLAASVTNTTTTSVTLTFSSGTAVDFGSLADGRYTLTVNAGQVSNTFGQLDGNGDGVAGDNYVLAGTPANGLFRLYGDNNGSGTVDALDFGAFLSAFGAGPSIFDFDNNGTTDAADFGQFLQRFGTGI